uniref:Uncharacterized protein n=1 Tax=Clastoptera arizonana TaxID=38151 RepID=A0A1B6C0Y2_9HEMI
MIFLNLSTNHILIFRRRKSSSPMCTAWRPPTSPKGKTRRKCTALPYRTQSVEGLLGINTNGTSTNNSNILNEPQSPPSRSHSVERILESPSPPSRTHSSEGLLESSPTDTQPEPPLEKSISMHNDLDAISDSVTSGSDTLKRKRNFMDRCVNKVRSLIKK